MTQYAQSKIFGRVMVAGPNEKAQIDCLIRAYPIDVIEALNVVLKNKGLKVGFGALEGPQRGQRMREHDDQGMGGDSMGQDSRMFESGPVS